jgi:hypothetical protein
MRPVKTITRMGVKEQSFVNVTVYPQLNNNMIITKKRQIFLNDFLGLWDFIDSRYKIGTTLRFLSMSMKYVSICLILFKFYFLGVI